MTSKFTDALHTILRQSDPPPACKGAPAPVERPAATAPRQRQEWFAALAASQIMPLLNQAATAARAHGADATARLAEENGHLAAELMIVRGPLPNGTRPPRLSVYATDDGARPLMIEFTGTFPHVGATGGFGAEVDFDPIYPSQLEEKILDFVRLAAGFGKPLR
jgi:hypothetical protein